MNIILKEEWKFQIGKWKKILIGGLNIYGNLKKMEFDDQIELEHLLFSERKCRVCGKIKNLVDDFYLTRKYKGTLPSAYSYECKTCTVKRIIKRRKIKILVEDVYPDW